MSVKLHTFWYNVCIPLYKKNKVEFIKYNFIFENKTSSASVYICFRTKMTLNGMYGLLIIGGSIRYIASNQTHNCTNSYSPDSPKIEKDTCEIVDENFVTLIEHGDM